MRTATPDLGRHSPRTRPERGQARAGIAACNTDWRAGELTTADQRLALGWSRVQRAGYELRWLELAATLITHEDVAALARWEGEGGA